MQENTFYSCSLKEWAILLALKACFTDESNSVHNLICFKSGLNRAEWVMEWQDFWVYQSTSNVVSLLPLLIPLLAVPVIVCMWDFHRKLKAETAEQKAKLIQQRFYLDERNWNVQY